MATILLVGLAAWLQHWCLSENLWQIDPLLAGLAWSLLVRRDFREVFAWSCCREWWGDARPGSYLLAASCAWMILDSRRRWYGLSPLSRGLRMAVLLAGLQFFILLGSHLAHGGRSWGDEAAAVTVRTAVMALMTVAGSWVTAEENQFKV